MQIVCIVVKSVVVMNCGPSERVEEWILSVSSRSTKLALVTSDRVYRVLRLVAIPPRIDAGIAPTSCPPKDGFYPWNVVVGIDVWR